MMRLHFYKKKVRRTVIFLCLLFTCMWIGTKISQSTMPYLQSIASYQVKSYVNTLLREHIDQEELVIQRKEGKYDVEAIRSQLSHLVEEASKLLQEEETVYELPFGALTQNVWLSHLGPNIPIKIRMLQEVQGDISYTIEEYGINNALVIISVVLQVDVEVITPYHLEQLSISSEIPLVIDILEGEVPSILPNWQ